MYRSIFKPFIDFFFAVVLLVLLCPLFVLIFLILLIHFRENPLFIQKRIGKNEVGFWILKFRTMNQNKNSNGVLLSDNERTTKIGLFIRKTGLDEIPQLLNILRGEMSFIGPRPLLPEYLPLYDSFSRKRHLIKPGITGLAQVNGGNSLAWKKRFEFDIFYINNYSFILDLKIIANTFKTTFEKKRQNIGALE